ncbi:alpha-amylase family glycosyl hydrolase [Salinispira pacifica]|uniref:pullulanase n=1 Tax=Salinispira pacifica TaxID=1307761 RepID=V5WEI5_9SPIO|nr:alpha-amylase family glycosyl hydrolase [Salinispira pacifica]AHC13566.1 Pullulanase [Salinispira pacifica]
MRKWAIVLSGLMSLLLVFASCATGNVSGGLQAEPGTIEVKGHPAMPKVAAAAEEVDPADDEIVIYYYRADENYEPWAFWVWAPGDGDGSLNFDYTQNIQVTNGVGYLKFKADGSDIGQSPVNALGEIGFIRRPDSGWDGQTRDFIWPVDTKGNEVVLFEDTLEPTTLGDYVPEFKVVVAEEPDLLKAALSGKHALTPEASDNGFVVKDNEGNVVPITDVVNMRAINDRSKNYTESIYIRLGEELTPDKSYTIEHPEYIAPEPVDISEMVLAKIDETTPAEDYELGAIYNSSAASVEFRLWAPLAKDVTALLYNVSIAENASAAPVAEVPMTKNADTGVWTAVYDEQDPDGFFYVYRVEQGNGLVRDVLDPYAKSMDAYMNEGGNGRAAIVDLAKAGPDGGWEGLESAQDGGYYQTREDAVIYEVSVRDFTISPDANVNAEPGTYEAFIEKIPYLVDMGVTHIQLMPTLNFYYTDETDKSYDGSGSTTNSNYNWGYDPHSYFTPEGWHSSDPADPYARMVELKNLVKAAHDSGLRVLLDVVYNHMGSTNFLEHILPGYFFRMNANGGFTSSSGVGNDFASTRKMARKLIVDSVRYLVDEYKIDGFRFDLMGLTDTETMEQAYAEAAEIKPDVLFEGEGWKMYNGPAGTRGADQDYMTSTDNISVFNDEIRDMLKGGGFNEEAQAFITTGNKPAEPIFRNLIGQPQGNYTADDPGDSMLYIAAHDGLTLADSIAHNVGLSNRSAEGRAEIAQRAKLGNFMILTGQGIPFIHAGQESGRTKPNVNNSRSETIGRFVRNSYDSADNINQFVWELPAEYEELRQFTFGLVDIRRANPVFRLETMEQVNEAAEFLPQSGEFKLAYKLSDGNRDYYLLVNAAEEAQDFTLDADVSGGQVLVDRVAAEAEGISNVQGVEINGDSVTLDALTPALIVVE